MKDRAVPLLLLAMVVLSIGAGLIAIVTLRQHGYYTEAGWINGWAAALKGWPLYVFIGLAFSCLISVVMAYSLEAGNKSDLSKALAKLEIENDSALYKIKKEREELSREYNALYEAKRLHEVSVHTVRQQALDSGAEARRAADKLARAERIME